MCTRLYKALIEKIETRKANIGVIGMGYVGLPLAIEFCNAGFKVAGFDVDPEKVALINRGKSYIGHIESAQVRQCQASLSATTDFSKLALMDCIVICVPTPLNGNQEPEMSYVFETARSIAASLQRGQLVVLESTTYPGTTDEDVRSILEKSDLKAGKDFYLAYSPEREDPRNGTWSTSTIPKVVGGFSPECLETAVALYDQIVEKTVPVSSTKVAEAAKLTENIYRAVNIALVNELKMIFDKMDIDIWEVIEAAKTKPFGFQAFYPGPGMGGHCIPIDPFYLAWKAREFDFQTRFIELAGEINVNMPNYVIDKTIGSLREKGKSIEGARILLLGLAYKKDVDDVRESPALKLIELFRELGADVDYHDPHVPKAPKLRKYRLERDSVPLTGESLANYDCVVIVTNHSVYDPEVIARHAQLVVDTRNLMGQSDNHFENVKMA